MIKNPTDGAEPCIRTTTHCPSLNAVPAEDMVAHQHSNSFTRLNICVTNVTQTNVFPQSEISQRLSSDQFPLLNSPWAGGVAYKTCNVVHAVVCVAYAAPERFVRVSHDGICLELKKLWEKGCQEIFEGMVGIQNLVRYQS